MYRRTARPGRADGPRQAAYEFVGRQLAQEAYERALAAGVGVEKKMIST